MDFRQIQIIWLALVGGVTSYMIVVYGLLVIGGMGLGTLPATLMPYVAVVGIVLVLAGLGLRRRLVAAIPRDTRGLKALEPYGNAVIIGLALAESGGILVITLSLVTDTPSWVLVGGGAAVWALVIGRPTREEAGLEGTRSRR